MRSRAIALAAIMAIGIALAADALAADRAKFDTRVLGLVPSPGFPARAYTGPHGRVYEGTYDNPTGDTVPSRVLEYTRDGTLQRSWTIRGQDLKAAHGVQVATMDSRGRLILLDKSPPRVLRLNLRNGRQSTYTTFPDTVTGNPTTPNYAAWGPDGSLYVTDYLQPIIWRVPPGGGVPRIWLQDPRLDGSQFGATGIVLEPDHHTLLVGMQSEGGGGSGNPATGRLWQVRIRHNGKPGDLHQLWESNPLDAPDGFAIGRSGDIYVALTLANQIAVISPQGATLDRFPDLPLTGDNGSPVPFDNPSSTWFDGRSLVVANQSFIAGNPANQAVLKVFVGERGQRELIPRNAGLRR